MTRPTGEVVLTVAGGLATITLAREAKRNALAKRHFIELVALLDAADADEAVAVIVLTGAGDRAFCAGADISKDEQFFETIGEQKTTGLGDVMRRARALTKPLIGRINGHCYAGGVGLLSACDIAIAADDARFALPEVTLGLFPFIVVAGLQPKLAATAIAELALTGAPASAARAVEIGLISHCVARIDLDASVAALASTLASLPRAAIKAGRPALSGMDDAAFEAVLAAAEAKTFALSAQRTAL
jgi:enoyl-CoA hydratase/carnithine racemase